MDAGLGGVGLLALLVWPLLGAGVVACMPHRQGQLARWIGVGWGGAEWGLALLLACRFDLRATGLQLSERYAWGGLVTDGIHLGMDVLSLGMVLLVTLLLPLHLAAAGGQEDEAGAGPTLGVLLLTASLVGVFLSRDLFWWVFWLYAALLCLCLLAGVWSGKGEMRRLGAVRMGLFGLVGAGLAAGCVLYLATALPQPVRSFDAVAGLGLPLAAQQGLLAVLLVGLALQTPLAPLHTWLPHICSRSPLAGGIALGVWGWVGIYGFLRLGLPLCGGALKQWQPYIETWALCCMLYGGWMALVQIDGRRRYAYITGAWMGAMLSGICAATAAGVAGALVWGVGVSLGASALALVARSLPAAVRKGRVDLGTRPLVGACWLVAAAVFCGLPGLGGYGGWWLIWQEALARHVGWGLGLLGVWGGIVWVLLGPVRLGVAGGQAYPRRWLVPPLIVLLSAAWLGWYPRPLMVGVGAVAAELAAAAAVAAGAEADDGDD